MKCIRGTIVLLAIISAGCAGSRDTSVAPTVIGVENYEGKMIEGSTFIEKIDSVTLQPSEYVHIASIRDICISDKSLYILDDLDRSINLTPLQEFKKRSPTARGMGKANILIPTR